MHLLRKKSRSWSRIVESSGNYVDALKTRITGTWQNLQTTRRKLTNQTVRHLEQLAGFLVLISPLRILRKEQKLFLKSEPAWILNPRVKLDCLCFGLNRKWISYSLENVQIGRWRYTPCAREMHRLWSKINTLSWAKLWEWPSSSIDSFLLRKTLLRRISPQRWAIWWENTVN